jgi:hypothetical protein
VGVSHGSSATGAALADAGSRACLEVIGMTRSGRMAYVLAMSGAYVRPFHAGDIPAAGALVAARHRTHRLSCPLLSPRYEQASAATAEVAAAFALPDASAQAGYDCVATDWRVTNLLSSRTRPRLGFAESFVRLHRLVGY